MNYTSTKLSFLHIPLVWGQLNIKLWDNALISERMKWVPTFKIGPMLFTWRKYQ